MLTCEVLEPVGETPLHVVRAWAKRGRGAQEIIIEEICHCARCLKSGRGDLNEIEVIK